MAVYYKPQSPIQSGEDFIYPITTADQIMKSDKSRRLEQAGLIVADNSTSLGGVAAEDYALKTDTAPDSSKLGGVAAEDYALKTDTAPDSSKLGGVAASDYALKTDTAPDSSKLGGKAPEYYIQPRNLLDNSDFRNPVNQRGITTTDSSFTGYVLDRWIAQNSGTMVTLDSNGLNVAASSGAIYLFQRLNNVKNGKTYTFAAALSDGTIGVCAFTLSSTTSTWEWIKEVRVSSSFQISVAHSDWMPLFVAMSNLTDTSARIIWAALYEGSYTAETLPPYVPKGYAAELAECRRYFRRYTAGNASLILSGLVTSGAKDISVNAPELAPMRTKSVSIAYSGSGVIIRGVSGYATECSGSRIYGDISIAPYQNNSSFCATIDINKKDGTAWGLTNNTPVVVSFAANSTLDYVADL